jgi:uncharacterized protein (TIGR02145 family)
MKNLIKFYFNLSFFSVLISFYSCQKKDVNMPILEEDTIMDIDSNTYRTVKIGNQWWMAENLKVTSYNDGTKIRSVLSIEHDSVWAKIDSGAVCKVDERYGMLYNWYAVNDSRKIAPKGWHVPTDEEWKILEKEIGMSQTEVDKTSWRGTNEAEKLIVKSSVGWPTTDVFGSNTSGFSALPSGCRLFNGIISSNSNAAFWWTASQKEKQVYYRNLDSKKKSIYRSITYKNYGFSVRCVKD